MAGPSPILANRPSLPLSPFVNSSIMTRTPATPFSVPRLRTGFAAPTPSHAPQAVAAPVATPMRSVSENAASLDWVRTPSSKTPTVTSASKSIIRLQSPLVVVNAAAPQQWKVPPPVSETPFLLDLL